MVQFFLVASGQEEAVVDAGAVSQDGDVYLETLKERKTTGAGQQRQMLQRYLHRDGNGGQGYQAPATAPDKSAPIAR